MRFGRRMVLKGVGGAVLGMPLFESFSKQAVAAGANETFAIFFRQTNGVAAAQNYSVNSGPEHMDPERFWPMTEGALTPANVQGRALEELNAHASKLLVVGNVTMKDFDYGDGHARGALQSLTTQGPVVANVGGDSEANGDRSIIPALPCGLTTSRQGRRTVPKVAERFEPRPASEHDCHRGRSE